MSKRSRLVARTIFNWKRYENYLKIIVNGKDKQLQKISVKVQEQPEILEAWDAEDCLNWEEVQKQLKEE